MLMSCVCLILNVTEIILFARRVLKPLTYLVLQCVKTALWVIIFLVVLALSVTGGSAESGDPITLLLSGVIQAVVLL